MGKRKARARWSYRWKKPLFDDDGNKLCSACGVYKPLSEFGPAKRSLDGHSSQCKECCRMSWRRNSDEYNATDKRQQRRRQTVMEQIDPALVEEAKRRQWYGTTVWWSADSSTDGLVGEIIGADGPPDGGTVWLFLDGRTPFRDTGNHRIAAQYVIRLRWDAVRAMTPAQVDDFWRKWKHKRRERVAYWRRVAANEERMHDKL